MNDIDNIFFDISSHMNLEFDLNVFEADAGECSLVVMKITFYIYSFVCFVSHGIWHLSIL